MLTRRVVDIINEIAVMWWELLFELGAYAFINPTISFAIALHQCIVYHGVDPNALQQARIQGLLFTVYVFLHRYQHNLDGYLKSTYHTFLCFDHSAPLEDFLVPGP